MIEKRFLESFFCLSSRACWKLRNLPSSALISAARTSTSGRGIADSNVIGRLHLEHACGPRPDGGARSAGAGDSRCGGAANVSINDIAAVGIAAPGAIDMPNGIVIEAPNLKWPNIPLRDELRRRIGRQVVVDNDVNAAIWGEFKLGAGRGFRDCLGVWCGTGVGGGLVLDGHLHHGSLHTAGEFGQQTIYPHAPRGGRIIEDFCSRTGISRLVRRMGEGFSWFHAAPDPKAIRNISRRIKNWPMRGGRAINSRHNSSNKRRIC